MTCAWADIVYAIVSNTQAESDGMSHLKVLEVPNSRSNIDQGGRCRILDGSHSRTSSLDADEFAKSKVQETGHLGNGFRHQRLHVFLFVVGKLKIWHQ
jgi:hypothetical protein